MVYEQNLIFPGSALVYVMFRGTKTLGLRQYFCLVSVG